MLIIIPKFIVYCHEIIIKIWSKKMKQLQPNEPFYQISQAAKLVGITSDRLRTYEEEGLIKPARTSNLKDGKRLFSQNEIEWIGMIRDLIKLGVSIPTIRILLVSKYPINHPALQNKDLEIIKLLRELKSHYIYKTLF